MKRLPHARLKLPCLGLICLALGGCANGFPLLTPGTIEQKRIRATIVDPYPNVELGPEVVGGRPRDYQMPLPQPVQNRIFADALPPP